MSKILVNIALITLLSQSIVAQVKTLKDSLLEIYTMEELKSMTSRERGNAVRLLRGQDPLPTTPIEPEFDLYGIKIIKEIPVDSMQGVIDARVSQINGEKATYRQEVFPNALIDVVDGYGYYFYESFFDRKVNSRDREAILTFIRESGEESLFSNFSRRVYYFNSSGELRLITREMTYNVNDGKQFNSETPWPLKYVYEEFYVWNDSLQYDFNIKAEQYVVGQHPDYWTQADVDSTLVKCEAYKASHFKNNCFNYYFKDSREKLEDWHENFVRVPFSMRTKCRNGTAIAFQNLVLEREEYLAKANDYLQPVPTSFLQPYIIEGK